MRTALRLAALAAFAATGSAQPAAAQSTDEDWPCIQRLVPQLEAGQMWAGPPLDGVEGYWQADADIAPLVAELVTSDLTPDAAVAKVDAFASSLPEEQRLTRLPLLFKGVLELVNGERDDLIAGIRTFAKKQRSLADRIAATSSRLEGFRLDSGAGSQPELEALKSERDWDLRIYDDRQRMLSPICDRPVLLEQRAFAIARAIQGYLP